MHPLRERHRDHQLGRPARRAEERERIEQRAVDALAEHRRADRAGPQHPPFVKIFIFASTKLLTNSPAQNAISRGEHDPRRLARTPPRRPAWPAPSSRRRRQRHAPPRAMNAMNSSAANPAQMHPPRVGIAVDLGQHVAEHVAHREEQHARAERPRPDPRQVDHRQLGRADHVRQQQDGDERRHHVVEIAERAPRARLPVDPRRFPRHRRLPNAICRRAQSALLPLPTRP